jgi:hypothetical protein
VRKRPAGGAGAAALLAVLAALPGCIGGVSPVECAIDSDCADGFCTGGFCHQGTRSCPRLQPTFSSIDAHLIKVGCGSKQNNCHSADSPALGSGPSFVGDAYRTLVGAPAENRTGSARGLILVKPGDPANSFLLTKLRLTDAANPLYGSGQPASAPGSVCAEAQAVIERWIVEGAQNN